MNDDSATIEMETSKAINRKDSQGSNFSDEISDKTKRKLFKKKVPYNPEDRPRRIPVGGIFENIFGIDDSETEGELPPPVVSKFLRPSVNYIDFDYGFERGDVKYAPSRRNPYYMAIQHDQFNELFGGLAKAKQWATTTKLARPGAMSAIKSYFNVSLKLFHDMANDNVDWLSLSRLVDPQVAERIDDDDEKEGVMLKEMAFDGLLDAPMDDPLEGQDQDAIEHHRVVILVEPMWQMEEDDPNPPDVHTVDAKLVDIDALWETAKDDISHEITNQKVRRIYLPIRHQMGWLMWVHLGYWGTTLEARQAQLRKIKAGFLKLWMTATATDPESAAGYRARFTSANLGFPLFVVPNHDNLSSRLNWPLNLINDRFKELVQKINAERNHVRTWLKIESKEGVKGEAWVKMGENPFNLFDTYIWKAHYNFYMESLEILGAYADRGLTRHDAHRDSKTSQTNLKDLKDWLHLHYAPMPKLNSKGQENYTKAQKDAMTAMDNWAITAANRKIPREELLYLKGNNCEFESTWRIDISRDKITNARGKRIAKYAPASIMGMPANETAEYALGWTPLDRAEELITYRHRMSNGFFMAEWLHLCAFSWGGLTNRSNKGELLYRSSDIPGNLVLGTSETNSAMTRFEKAWQTLVLDSTDFDSARSCPKLIVTRNSRKEVVIRDEKDATTGNYHRIESKMSKEEEGIASAYDFLAYTISYSMRFPDGSRLLNTTTPFTLNTTFYPFLRPVYHKLEDQLDKALYEEMKTRLLNEPQLSHGGFVSQTLSLHPHNQDGSTVFASTRPYGGNFFGPQMDYNSSTRSGKTRYNSIDKSDIPSLKQVKKTKKKPTSDIDTE